MNVNTEGYYSMAIANKMFSNILYYMIIIIGMKIAGTSFSYLSLEIDLKL